MKLAIMQPYFFPYVGYFQLIAVSDLFVVYDNVQYTKKGWINRNRMLQNGSDVRFSLSLAKDSDFLDVRDRRLSSDFDPEKLLNLFRGAYRKAPYFDSTFPFLEEVVRHDEPNLFDFLHRSIEKTCARLEISTTIRVSSDIDMDHDLKNQDRVLAVCDAVGADHYVNPIGGLDLYSKDEFREQGITLEFLQSQSFEYEQFGDPFVPWLSIVDVMMFNSPTEMRALIQNYTLM